jgi:hypothetical protein
MAWDQFRKAFGFNSLLTVNKHLLTFILNPWHIFTRNFSTIICAKDLKTPTHKLILNYTANYLKNQLALYVYLDYPTMTL